MKQGNTLPNIMVMLLAIGLALYFIFSFWESVTDSFTTAIAYEHTVSDSVDGKGVLIREEVLLPTISSGLLDVLRSEGEQVGVGQVVCRVYRDSGAMAVQNQLEMLTTEAKSLEYALSDERELVTVARMDEEIVASIATLLSHSTMGNYNKLEEEIAQVKGTVLRRDYMFGSAQVAKDLEDRYAQVVFEMSNSAQVSSNSMQTVTSPVSGAYSILVDGLEYLNYQMALNLTLEDLNQIVNSEIYSADYGVGKIITGDSWFFVTAIPTVWADELQVGKGMTVRFSGDFSQDITMIVEKVTPAENDTSLVILSSNRYLEQTTLLRVQSVELVYASYTGLRIPKEALRMEQYTNSETGEVTTTYGVYALSAGYAEFKPVQLITETKDFYLVQATNQSADALRQGNEIIVNALGLYTGKLLEY